MSIVHLIHCFCYFWNLYLLSLESLCSTDINVYIFFSIFVWSFDWKLGNQLKRFSLNTSGFINCQMIRVCICSHHCVSFIISEPDDYETFVSYVWEGEKYALSVCHGEWLTKWRFLNAGPFWLWLWYLAAHNYTVSDQMGEKFLWHLCVWLEMP